MTENELLQKVKDPKNWTDDFLEKADALIAPNWNRIREALVQLGLYDAFDRAYCERKKPGQVGFAVPAERKDPGRKPTQGPPRRFAAGPKLVTMAEIQEKEPEWLIPDYIPKGQITILAGDGGAGKTSVWRAIAASVSSGSRCFLNRYEREGNENPFLPKEGQGLCNICSSGYLPGSAEKPGEGVHFGILGGRLRQRSCRTGWHDEGYGGKQ